LSLPCSPFPRSPLPRSPLVRQPLIRYYSSDSDNLDDPTPGEAYLRCPPANDLLSEETESRQDPGKASSGAEFESDTEASSGSADDSGSADSSVDDFLDELSFADSSGDNLDSADDLGSADGSADDFGSEASSRASGGEGGGYWLDSDY
jgi:hypothetical protein